MTKLICHGYTANNSLIDSLTLQGGEDYLCIQATPDKMGPPPASYAWTRDGQLVSEPSGGRIGPRFLAIPNPTAADAGLYVIEWPGPIRGFFAVSQSAFVPAALAPLPPTSALGAPIVLNATGGAVQVRWLNPVGAEIAGSPRDSLTFTPKVAGYVIALVWNIDPNAPARQQGVTYDDATGREKWSPGAYHAKAFTLVS